MKHSLQLKLSQHLTLTPQLQQSIKLLQLSTVELNQELERYLLENPLLERGDIPPDEAPVAGANVTGGSEAASEAVATQESEAVAAQESETPEYSFGDEPITISRRRNDDEDR